MQIYIQHLLLQQKKLTTNNSDVSKLNYLLLYLWYMVYVI